jgi:hypothetical protein
MAKKSKHKAPAKKHKPPQKKPLPIPAGQDPRKTFASHPHAATHPFEPMGRKR